MTTYELANIEDFSLLVKGENTEIKGLYCCDLLSHVMGQSLAGNAWFTVMANINSLAVASLSDAACVVLCHGIPATEDMVNKAAEQGINLFLTELAQFDAALKIGKLAKLV